MTQEITPANNALVATGTVYQTLKEQARTALRSKLIPASVDNEDKAIVIVLKGHEIGIPPLQALTHISIINGKPTMSAELMLSQIYKHVRGAVVDYLETTDQVCRIEAQRPGGRRTKFQFSMEDAKQADLLRKQVWKNYPAAMLRARAVSITARALFPDAINGVSYTPEELGQDTLPEFEEDHPGKVPLLQPKVKTSRWKELVRPGWDNDSIKEFCLNKFKKPWSDLDETEFLEVEKHIKEPIKEAQKAGEFDDFNLKRINDGDALL